MRHPSPCLFLLFFPLLIRDEKTWGSAVKVENSLTYYVVISATDGRLARSSSVSLSILGNLEFIQKVQRSLDKMELLLNLIKVKWKSAVYVCKQLTQHASSLWMLGKPINCFRNDLNGIFWSSIYNKIISSVMHAFWLVLTYDLLEDRRIDDVIIKTFFRVS